MIYNDVSGFYEQYLSDFEDIFQMNLQLKDIYANNQVWKNHILTMVYNQDFVSQVTYTNTIKEMNNYMDTVKKQLLSINFLTIGFKLGAIERNAKSINPSLYEKTLEPIFNSLATTSSHVYTFLASNDSTIMRDLYAMMNSINTTINVIDNFYSEYSLITSIGQMLEHEIPDNENYELLSIQFYNENLNFNQFVTIIQSVNEMYERLCTLCSISENEYKLIPIKMESGSFFEKVLGNAVVIKILEQILIKGFNFCYSKYTSEGAIQKEISKLEYLKNELDIISELKKANINVDEANEEIQQQMLIVTKNLTRLFSQSPKVKINDNIISIEREFEKKYLENTIKFLEEDTDINKNIVEIEEIATDINKETEDIDTENN